MKRRLPDRDGTFTSQRAAGKNDNPPPPVTPGGFFQELVNNFWKNINYKPAKWKYNKKKGYIGAGYGEPK